MYCGWARMIRSARPTSQSMPPAASMTDAAVITAMMISITSMGGVVGAAPNPKIRTASPTPPHTPSPTPPTRAPTANAARTTMSSRMNTVMAWTLRRPHDRRRDRSAVVRAGRKGRSDEVPLPVENDAELVAELRRVLLVEDVGARPEPKALEEEGLTEFRAVVDGGVVLGLVGRPGAGLGIDRVPTPGQAEVGPQTLCQHPGEVVGGTDHIGLLVGLVEILVDHREVARIGSPRGLNGVAGPGDREGRGERQVSIDELHAGSAHLNRPVFLRRVRQESVAHCTLVRDLRA